jgi:hypothetical protein
MIFVADQVRDTPFSLLPTHHKNSNITFILYFENSILLSLGISGVCILY